MGLKLRDELTTTPPKLALSSLPSHKPLAPGSPWALTPPLHPMVSIPFEWEEAPGRPRPNNISSPCKPKSVKCLELPPRLLVEAKVAHMPASPTTVLDGPRSARSLSHRFCFEGPSPKTSPGLGLVANENDMGRSIGPWKRWASGNGAKWNLELSKENFDLSSWEYNINNGSIRYDTDTDVEVKITRFSRRSRGSLYKLSQTSSRVLVSFTLLLHILIPYYYYYYYSLRSISF